MLNLLWLLLPVAAAGGWFAGRRNAREGESDAFWSFASNYHQGLNYLLNEPPDSALDLFESAGDVDQETAETHLALGNMFRRRGEVDRAIRIHESLAHKEELAQRIRSDAMLELAQDYDSAGLLDRSEAQFRDLISRGFHVETAFRNLLQIAERAHDWKRAIEIADELAEKLSLESGADPITRTAEQMRSAVPLPESVQAGSGHETGVAAALDLDQRVAHYHCELAEEAVKQQQYDVARDLLQQALDRSPTCARASIDLAELAAKKGEHSKAVELYELVESNRPELMPEIIDPLFEALKLKGDEQQLRAYIERIQSRFNAYSVIRSTRAVIESIDGSGPADAFFKDQIVKRPSLKGLSDWARSQLSKSPPYERDKVGAMCDMLDQVVRDKPGYVCTQCGFRGQSLHWRCPSCGNWDSVKTVIGAEGE